MKRLSLVGLFCLLGACTSVKDSFNHWFRPGALAESKMSALVPLPVLVKPKILWQRRVGAAEQYIFSPKVVGNTLWVSGANGRVYSLAANTGAINKEFRAGGNISSGVAANAKIVVLGTDKGEMMAYNPAGQWLWKSQLSSQLLSVPVMNNELIVARSSDGAVFGFDQATGARRWNYQRSTPSLLVRNASSVTILENIVLAGFPGGRLVALNKASGAVAWESVVALPKGTTELERVADITSTPYLDSERACAIAYQGKVACFDPLGGSALWNRDISSYVGMDADESNFYIVDDKDSVLAVTKSAGSSVWKQDKLAARGLSRPLAFGRYVIVGDSVGYLHILSREDGAFVGRIATDGSAIGVAPTILDLTSFVVQTRKGGIFAITLQ